MKERISLLEKVINASVSRGVAYGRGLPGERTCIIVEMHEQDNRPSRIRTMPRLLTERIS